MRPLRWTAAIVVLAALLVGGFFAGAAFFDERPVLETIHSPTESGGERAH